MAAEKKVKLGRSPRKTAHHPACQRIAKIINILKTSKRKPAGAVRV